MIPNSVTPASTTSPSASSIPFTFIWFHIDFTFEFKSGLIHVRIICSDNFTILKIKLSRVIQLRNPWTVRKFGDIPELIAWQYRVSTQWQGHWPLPSQWPSLHSLISKWSSFDFDVVWVELFVEVPVVEVDGSIDVDVGSVEVVGINGEGFSVVVGLVRDSNPKTASKERPPIKKTIFIPIK